MRFSFDPNLPNPNDIVAQRRVDELSREYSKGSYDVSGPPRNREPYTNSAAGVGLSVLALLFVAIQMILTNLH